MTIFVKEIKGVDVVLSGAEGRSSWIDGQYVVVLVKDYRETHNQICFDPIESFDPMLEAERMMDSYQDEAGYGEFYMVSTFTPKEHDMERLYKAFRRGWVAEKGAA